MPTNYTIPEILTNIKNNARSPQDIVNDLRKNESAAILETLRFAFDGHPWYRKDLPAFTSDGSPEGLAPSSLWAEIKRFYIFKQGYGLPMKRKDEILIQVLESVGQTEVELVRSMFDGSFVYTYGIDKKTAEAAFPNLFVPKPVRV